MNGISKEYKRSPLFYPLYFTILLYLILFIVAPLLLTFSSVSIKDIIAVLKANDYKKVIAHSFLLCFLSSTLSVIVGYLYAYIIEEFTLPARKVFAALPLIHLVTPPFISGLSFILLFGRQGLVTKTLLHLDLSIYGLWGIVLSQVSFFFPVAYLISRGVIQNINPLYKDVAHNMGASRIKVFITITLPLSFPALLSSLLFIAVSSLSDFGNPMLIGGRYQVLSTAIYTSLTTWLDSKTSIVLGQVLFIPSLTLFIAQNIYTNKNKIKVAMVGDRSVKDKVKVDKSHLTPLQVLAFLFCSFIALLLIMQLLSIVAASITRLWQVDNSFTLSHIKHITRYKDVLLNTLKFSLISATLTSILAFLISFYTCKTTIFARNLLDILSLSPSCICGTLLGLSFLTAASKLHFDNSSILIVLSMITSFLPFAYKNISSAMMEHKESLQNAAYTLGASPLYALVTITLPLSIKDIFRAFIYVFSRSLGTLSAIVFLVSYDNKTTSLAILNLSGEGYFGDACALSSFLLIITFTLFIALNAIVKRNKRK